MTNHPSPRASPRELATYVQKEVWAQTLQPNVYQQLKGNRLIYKSVIEFFSEEWESNCCLYTKEKKTETQEDVDLKLHKMEKSRTHNLQL